MCNCKYSIWPLSASFLHERASLKLNPLVAWFLKLRFLRLKSESQALKLGKFTKVRRGPHHHPDIIAYTRHTHTRLQTLDKLFWL